ncbi:MAG: TIGR02757 family protein [Spirochaetes bacterium]|nr:TIGR02757 family protein [Spirochaetota bacterium]
MHFSDPSTLKTFLEGIYKRFHQEEYIDPDPLSRVRRYVSTEDREVAGFICASLALGRVEGILKACDAVLIPLGEPLKERLIYSAEEDLDLLFRDFRYRFFRKRDIVAFLSALRGVLRRYGTIEECFARGYSGKIEDPGQGIESIFRRMTEHRNGSWGILLSDPSKKGGMKRWHLFLRWMVRKDRIDPGGWICMNPASLRVPVDTHLYRWSHGWGFTHRKGIDRATVEEITDAFRKIDPSDPVRFDFSLSRIGIHPKAREVYQKNLVKTRKICHNKTNTT